MEPLAALEELQARLDWDLDTGEELVATGALEDLSDDARFYGSDSWTSASVAPRQVKSLVLRAAARFMRNPDGYVSSRAGDEAVTWSDRGHSAGSPYFTREERESLASLAGRSSIYSVDTVAWGPTKKAGPGYAPTDVANQKQFPFYADDQGSV